MDSTRNLARPVETQEKRRNEQFAPAFDAVRRLLVEHASRKTRPTGSWQQQTRLAGLFP
jgi:hypothetical protein